VDVLDASVEQEKKAIRRAAVSKLKEATARRIAHQEAFMSLSSTTNVSASHLEFSLSHSTDGSPEMDISREADTSDNDKTVAATGEVAQLEAEDTESTLNESWVTVGQDDSDDLGA
jgi:nitric oxide reductase activation protein